MSPPGGSKNHQIWPNYILYAGKNSGNGEVFENLVFLDAIWPSADLVVLERGSATNLTGFDSCWPQGMGFCVSGAPAPLDRPGVGLYSSLPYFLAPRQVLSPVDYCRCRVLKVYANPRCGVHRRTV